MNSEKQVDGYGCISKVHMENPCCGERDTPRSVKTCSIPKMEPKHVEQLICSPKTCSIFGGHDLNPKTEKYVSPHSKKRNKDSNTLGSPIGLVKSSVSAKSDVKGSEIHVQKFATYLKAFAKVYVTPEIEWTTAVLDLLLKEGQQLHAESLKEYTSAEADSLSTVYSEAESKVKRSFEFAGCTFQLELNDKFRLSSMEQGGDELIPDMIVELLKPAFKGFFRHRKYCLLKVSSWYLMIWKARGVWFVLDFYGRRLNDFATDREKGLAMLICLKALDNVCHLLMHLSGIQKSDTFSLRELKVVKLVGLDGKTVNREFGKRTNQYEILSYDYALLRADLHLSLNSAEPLRSRSGLPVAVAALLASKIDHPATWNQKQLNKIICYGVNMCKSVWKQCLSSQNPVPVEKFPLQLKIGQFIVGYSIAVRKHEGTWKCVPNYKNSDLAMAIEQSFQERDNNLILQIANQFYPIWMKNNFIYLLDPYRHRCVGTPPSEPNEEGEGGEATPTDGKSASLRMFRTVDAFLKVFTQILLETNKTTPFYLHRLQVKKLSLAEKAEGVPDVEEAPEDGAEVKSLNETICFEEDEAQCLEELGEISDYEEEDDVTSDVVQLDEKEPASESDDSEEDMEEEEMGMEGLSEYESSSSGDGDGHSRRRKKKGKGKKDEDAKSDKDKKKKKGKDKKEKKDKDKSDKDKKDKTGKKEKKEKPKKEKTEKDKKEKPEKPEKEKKDTKEKKRKSKKEKDTDGESAEDKDNKENKKDNKEDDTSKDDKKRQSKKEKVPEKDKPEVPKKKSIAPPGEKSITNAADGNNKKDSKSNNDDDQNKSDQDKGRAGSGSKFGSTTTKGASSFSQQDERAQKSRGGGSDDDDEDKDDRDSLSCKPNNYPGYSTVAHDMAVVGSESGSYESICKLLRAGFKCADRILTMTPWGNYVVFRGNTVLQKIYFLFDGCTCNVNRFRHLDLNCGTAGLLCFQNLHDVICYILDSHKIRTNLKKSRKNIVDEICKQYLCGVIRNFQDDNN